MRPLRLGPVNDVIVCFDFFGVVVVGWGGGGRLMDIKLHSQDMRVCHNITTMFCGTVGVYYYVKLVECITTMCYRIYKILRVI